MDNFCIQFRVTLSEEGEATECAEVSAPTARKDRGHTKRLIRHSYTSSIRRDRNVQREGRQGRQSTRTERHAAFLPEPPDLGSE